MLLPLVFFSEKTSHSPLNVSANLCYLSSQFISSLFSYRLLSMSKLCTRAFEIRLHFGFSFFFVVVGFFVLFEQIICVSGHFFYFNLLYIGNFRVRSFCKRLKCHLNIINYVICVQHLWSLHRIFCFRN